VGLPAIGGNREFAEAGFLATYGTNIFATVRRLVSYVDRILKGAKPGDLPIERPTKFELVVNLKTAKTLGLTIPRTVLAQADDVIE
jgi:putative ABC transport system substrate-binding protein